MTDKDYCKSLIDIIPDEYMDEVISVLLSFLERNGEK